MPADDKPFRPDPVTAKAHLDAFVNFITGVGNPFADKTQGGLATGPDFFLRLIKFAQAEARYRGSDLGRNIVDKPIDEMLRRGLGSVEVQPSEDEAEIAADVPAKMDAARREPRRAAAGWRRAACRLDGPARIVARERARRWDAVAIGAMPPTAAPPPPPGPLPQINAEGLDIADAIEEWAGNLPTNAGGGKGAITAISQALRWERAFGGGCVFIGVEEDGPSGVTLDSDNGVRLDAKAPNNLTAPLDPKRVRRVTHLTALRGGVDGVVTMWRPYRFAISPKFGLPEIFQVQNSTVPIAAVPAPGEFLPPEEWPKSPSGPTLFYVHESRFLIFDGEPTSIESRLEMKGWGDSIFTRVNDPLLQFEQGWQAVGILMQEASIASEGIEGFTRALAEKDPAAREAFLFVAQTKALMRSVARTNYHDATATFTRQNVTFAGLADLLDRQVDRIAAAAEEPVSVLFGNLKGGLGATEDPSTRSWYATIEAKREKKLRPAVEYLYRLGFKSKEGPTHGTEPDKWSLTFRPLRQLDELEQADLRLKTSQADDFDIKNQIITPEESAATRYGGSEYNPGTIVLDMDARSHSAEPSQSLAEPPAVEDEPAPALEGAAPVATSIQATIPPIRMMATDPLTGTPASTSTTLGETAGGVPEGTPGRADGARSLAEAVRILTGEDEDNDEETRIRAEGWEPVDDEDPHIDAARDQPRDERGRFAAVEGARAAVAQHVAQHLSSQGIGATAEGSAVKLHVGGGSIEIGRKGERTYSSAGAHVQNAVEAHLTEHPAKHIAAWAKKTTPAAATVLALPAHVEPAPSKPAGEYKSYEERARIASNIRVALERGSRKTRAKVWRSPSNEENDLTGESSGAKGEHTRVYVSHVANSGRLSEQGHVKILHSGKVSLSGLSGKHEEVRTVLKKHGYEEEGTPGRSDAEQERVPAGQPGGGEFGGGGGSSERLPPSAKFSPPTPATKKEAKEHLRRVNKQIAKLETEREANRSGGYDLGVRAMNERLRDFYAARDHFEKWIKDNPRADDADGDPPEDDRADAGD